MGRERLRDGNRVGFLSICCEGGCLGVQVVFASCSAFFFQFVRIAEKGRGEMKDGMVGTWEGLGSLSIGKGI